MTYQVTGSGAPVVLVHAIGLAPAMWQPQVAALADRYQVVTYHLRGHGPGPAPPGPYTIADLGGDLVALLDRLGLDRATIGGVSLGGMVGLWVAAHAPHRVAALLVACTSAVPDDHALWTGRIAAVRAGGMAALATPGSRSWFTPSFTAAQPDLYARLEAEQLAVPPEGYAGCCAAIDGLDLTAELARITTPTVVVSGAQDPTYPPAHGRHIQERVPSARLVVLDPAAHLANLEQPEAFNRELAALLSG